MNCRFDDPRKFQLLFQALFLSYGSFVLHWESWWLYATYFCTSLLTQFFCILVFLNANKRIAVPGCWQQIYASIPSALITAFGLSLLLKTNHFPTAFLAAAISIISKFVFKINGKHIFNPSALGIAVSILISGDAWISPGQWGSNITILFSVLLLGTIVVTRVQKLDVSISFLGVYAGLLFVRQIIFLGWPMDFYVQTLCTGSLLLFSFFMITDPKTIPNHRLARILWTVIVAAVSFYLVTFKFIPAAPIFVLVIAQPLVPLLDLLFESKEFEWNIEATATSLRLVEPDLEANLFRKRKQLLPADI